MNKLAICAIGISAVCFCSMPVYGTKDAVKNRRNPFTPRKKTVQTVVMSERSVTPTPHEQMAVSMPDMFETHPVKEKPIAKKPSEPDHISVQKDKSSYKKPGVHRNDPESFSVDFNAFYSLLNKEGREIFDGLNEEGKSLAWRLSFPYIDKNKAVEDAHYEMERRDLKLNARNIRARRLKARVKI